MSKINVELYGHVIEVEYDYTVPEKGSRKTPSVQEWLDIYDYRFESEEVAEEFGLYDERSRRTLENKLAEIIIEHERAQNLKRHKRARM